MGGADQITIIYEQGFKLHAPFVRKISVH